MKALWETLAHNTWNLTLSTPPCWNPGFKFPTPPLLPRAVQCLLGVFTDVQGPNAHLCKYSWQLTCQTKTPPSPGVLGAPYWPPHITRRGGGGGARGWKAKSWACPPVPRCAPQPALHSKKSTALQSMALVPNTAAGCLLLPEAPWSKTSPTPTGIRVRGSLWTGIRGQPRPTELLFHPKEGVTGQTTLRK